MTNEEVMDRLQVIKEIYEVDPAMIEKEDVKALDIAIANMLSKRQHGKWIYNDLGYLICSNCGYDCLYDEEGLYSLGCFCHHCGADMRGEDNGS